MGDFFLEFARCKKSDGGSLEKKNYGIEKVFAHRVENIIASWLHQFLALGVAISQSYDSRRLHSSTR